MADIGTRLRWARKQKFKNAADAARALGVPYGTYSTHEGTHRGIPRDKIIYYAKAFKVSAEWLLTGQGNPDRSDVPVIGLAGATNGGGISYDRAVDLGSAPMPPGGSEATVAVEVRGESMRGVAPDGWFIYYDDRRDPPTDDLIGDLCVVGLDDDQTLVKYLYPGSQPGLFNLESTAAPTLRDARVVWAALVIAIIPRRQARKLGVG